MNTERLCLNCMAGYVEGGVCTHCKKTAGAELSDRPADALPAGFSLANGRYYLGKVLGKGGYGITYLAWDRKWNRRIAIKELYPQNAVRRDVKTRALLVEKGMEEDFAHLKLRFSQEAQILHALQDYPEIVKVYHLFEEYGTAYYAMEYLEGEDLGRFLRKNGRMSWKQLQKPVWTVLRSLQILHAKGLFHRDISPNNIFLLPDGGTRLIDFGSVRSYAGSGIFTTILNACYAPQELWDSEGKQGPWSDVFSLSVTMYHALTGVLPPKAPERIARRALYGEDPVQPLSVFHPDAPDYVLQAVKKGMELDMEARWQSASELVKALYPVRPSFVSGVYEKPAAQPVAGIACISGSFQGKKFPVWQGQVVSIGRSLEAKIRYPDSMRLVSRNQCSFTADNKGMVYVKDEGSSNGTFLDGRRIIPGQWIRVQKNQTIRFASEAYRIY